MTCCLIFSDSLNCIQPRNPHEGTLQKEQIPPLAPLWR